jgi:hypothetical protein
MGGIQAKYNADWEIDFFGAAPAGGLVLCLFRSNQACCFNREICVCACVLEWKLNSWDFSGGTPLVSSGAPRRILRGVEIEKRNANK